MEKDEAVVGRARDCDIVVLDPIVSRRHCVLAVMDGALHLQNATRENVTIVNGEVVSHCVLNVGDELAVGNARFIVAHVSDWNTEDGSEELSGTTVSTLGDLSRDASVVHGTPLAIPRDLRDLVALRVLVTRLGAAETLETLAAEIMTCLEDRIQLRRSVVGIRHENASFFELYSNTGTEADPKVFRNLVNEDLSVPAQFTKVESSTACEVEREIVRVAASGSVLALHLEWPDEPGLDYDGQSSFAACAMETACSFLPLLLSKRTEGHSDAKSFSSIESTRAVFVGNSVAAEHIRITALHAARAGLPVLIEGETGTGKEVVSRLLHQFSSRSEAPFLSVNCASIPDGLFESEFFGHEKGAFTGAASKRTGLLQQAHGGVLFLDEISELSALGQARLLRAVELGTFRPIGGEREQEVDVWIVAASNVDLLRAIEAKQFRGDLYYRLLGINIRIPPLRERLEDVAPLVQTFARQFAGEFGVEARTFSDADIALFRTQSWPGNARELRSTVRRVLALPTMTVSQALGMASPSEGSDGSERPTLDDVERMYIEAVLRQTEGNIKEAAKRLGLHRNTLAKKLKHYGLKP